MKQYVLLHSHIEDDPDKCYEDVLDATCRNGTALDFLEAVERFANDLKAAKPDKKVGIIRNVHKQIILISEAELREDNEQAKLTDIYSVCKLYHVHNGEII